MPIKRENRHLYPKDWQQIRKRILERAGHKCEQCGVEQYAVGYRDESGQFWPLCGSGPCDAAGQGKMWPSMEPLHYCEAKEFADHYNSFCGGVDDEGNHWIVIVLTMAHLKHDLTNDI